MTTTLSAEQAKASRLQSEITSSGQQIDALDQQYDADEIQLGSVNEQISNTEGQIAATDKTIAKDRQTLRSAAVNAYVTGGTAATTSIFQGNQTQIANAQVYDQVVTGNLTGAVDRLNTALDQLQSQRSTLKSEQTQKAAAVTAAKQATESAHTLLAQQQTALGQVNGQIANLVAEQQAAQAAAQAAAEAEAVQAAAAQRAASRAPIPAPPPASGGAGSVAVAAAETQLGVPYVWGAETPGNGFDCSGLVAWAWGQAGVYLPHYSGAQMADSTPVPVTDLEPGDLLFYGAGGSQHVAMYIGGGEVIEAPHTGTVVRIDPARIGTSDFAGAGRP